MSINMIKLCDKEIVNPLYLICTECLETDRFPSSWKKANVLLIHKKRTDSRRKIINPSFLYLFGENLLKSTCLTQFMSTSVQINCSHPINLVFDQATRQSINSSLLRIKHIPPLKNFLRERQGLFLDIFKALDKI